MKLERMRRFAALGLALALCAALGAALAGCGRAEGPAERALILGEYSAEERAEQMRRLTDAWSGDWPDYYGGMYVERDSVVVCVTCDPETVRDEICRLAGADFVGVRRVAYSWRRLTEVCAAAEARRAAAAPGSRGTAVGGFRISPRLNRVCVNVDARFGLSADELCELVGARDEIALVY